MPGQLCAAISALAPRAADAPELAAIHEILTDGNWVPSVVLASMMPLALKVAEEPALDPDQFEALISRRLGKMSDGEIRHWLRHGRGPLTQDVERLIPDRPRTAIDVFSEMEQRPRLQGTLALAARLEGLLWLPSRRLERPVLQGGGYTDVTTRGAPERILPIQFALDGEEFIRRFAESELLYFHREEPREPISEELVLLLDQGVRTWGDVRLVLSRRGDRACAAGWTAADRGHAGDDGHRRRASRRGVDRAGRAGAADRGQRSFSESGRGAREIVRENGARPPRRRDLDPSAEPDRGGRPNDGTRRLELTRTQAHGSLPCRST